MTEGMNRWRRSTVNGKRSHKEKGSTLTYGATGRWPDEEK